MNVTLNTKVCAFTIAVCFAGCATEQPERVSRKPRAQVTQDASAAEMSGSEGDGASAQTDDAGKNEITGSDGSVEDQGDMVDGQTDMEEVAKEENGEEESEEAAVADQMTDANPPYVTIERTKKLLKRLTIKYAGYSIVQDTVYEKHANGKVKTATMTSNHVPDVLGKTSKVTLQQTTVSQYDTDGRLLNKQVTGLNPETISYQYDAAGRVTKEEKKSATKNDVRTYEYDGNLVKRTVDQNGVKSSHVFDLAKKTETGANGAWIRYYAFMALQDDPANPIVVAQDLGETIISGTDEITTERYACDIQDAMFDCASIDGATVTSKFLAVKKIESDFVRFYFIILNQVSEKFSTSMVYDDQYNVTLTKTQYTNPLGQVSNYTYKYEYVDGELVKDGNRTYEYY